MWIRILGWLLDVIPTWPADVRLSDGRMVTRQGNPLWNIVFSYYDDANGCGCWRESGNGRRWQ